MQLKVSEGKQSLVEEEEEETGPGTKLGIVKLGKVAGKVRLGSYETIQTSLKYLVATCISFLLE